MPGFIKPQLATLKSRAPKGEQWLHEIKYDGYRVQVHLNRGRKKVFTRNGLDWTKRFTEIAGALAIPGEAIIDGEVVVVHEGRTNFSELQAELAAGRQGRLVYYAFDLLWRNGDLRKLPQLERKQALLDLLGENDVGLSCTTSKACACCISRRAAFSGSANGRSAVNFMALQVKPIVGASQMFVWALLEQRL
jgi:bifunctional non-homologous end joining protein LigD